MTATLVTIAFSHYCEKARWALDRASVAYREERYVPVVHLLGTLARGGRSTPLLRLADGRVLGDSSDILRYADSERPGSLFPKDEGQRGEAEAWEELFDEQLGPHARRLAYRAILGSGESFAPVIRQTTTGAQRAAAPLLAAFVPAIVKRGLKINDEGVARSREKVEVVLARVEAALTDGRRYLVGKGFTAADLAFAALLAPLVNPPEQPVTGAMRSPSRYAKLVAEYADRPASAFVRRLYAEERPIRIGPARSRLLREATND